MIANVREPYASLPVYARAVSAVNTALLDGKPLNVHADEAVVTGEHERACIVVIPHHQLGGVSVLVWSDAAGVQLSWSYITTLMRHDDIDRAVGVGTLLTSNDVDSVASALVVEMSRPITVQVKSTRLMRPTLECSIELDGQRKIIGRVRSGQFPEFEGVLTTSLAADPLPFEIAVPLNEWHQSN
jgi:hypothetical protein